MLWGGRWERGSCLGTHVRIKDFKIKKIKNLKKIKLKKKISYDYTVKVRNRFKGLDQIEYLMNYGQKFMTLYRRQGSRPSPWKRNAKKQNGCLGRPYK